VLKWISLIVGSLAYWLLWLGIAALVMWVHGDCWAGTTTSEAAICANEKRWVGIAVLAVALLLYAVTLRRLGKRSQRR
jgi:hypothetical protein